MTDHTDFLKSEKIDPDLIEGIIEYKGTYPPAAGYEDRVPAADDMYYGKDIWEQAIASILCGKNLLLAGPKATGKNVLAHCLAAVFGRPAFDVSFHINSDSSALIGADTFKNGEVSFRKGPVLEAAECGGFAVLDEINMAKNEALAVLHGILDLRRAIDVPGYDLVHVNKASRFIATMNYGYAGTRDLNEALASRFVIIDMPFITNEDLHRLLRKNFPLLKDKYIDQFALLFFDIKAKCDSGETSTKALDLRGLIDAIDLISMGLDAGKALDLGITDKTFDSYEKALIRDVIKARIPADLNGKEMFRN